MLSVLELPATRCRSLLTDSRLFAILLRSRSYLLFARILPQIHYMRLLVLFAFVVA
jgi:hypothetical protein